MDDGRTSYLPRVNAIVFYEVIRPGLTKAWVQRLLRDERPCGDPGSSHHDYPACAMCGAVV